MNADMTAIDSDDATSQGAASITLPEVERLFVKEAALLDQWKLQEWLSEMLTDDAQYLVPSLDSPDSDHRTALFLVADTYQTLASRVGQMLGRSAWAENPRSRTRRLVTNFDIVESHGASAKVTANFAVWRFHRDQTDVYVGRYVHLVARIGDHWRIRERRTILDMETLRPHGKLSFIL
jgi:p-cumate 2,3-dioxygenase beta subunit